MESMKLKIQELKKEISEFNAQTKKDANQIEKLNLEINQVKSMTDEVNCSVNDLTRRFENLRSELKNIHESYQRLPKRSMQEYIQCEMSKRKEELSQEKQIIESQLGRVKLNRSLREEKSEELNTQAMIQQKQKKALILKLQKNIEQSEELRRKAVIKFSELRKEY